MTATATRTRTKAVTVERTGSLFNSWESDLATQWEPLIRHVVFTYFRNLVNAYGEDEVVSEANYALARAIRYYNPNYISPKTGRPVQVNTYSINIIKRSLTTWAGKRKEKEERLRFVPFPVRRRSSDYAEAEDVQYADTKYADMVAEMDDAEAARVELRKRLRSVRRTDRKLLKQYLGGFYRGRPHPRRTVKELAAKYGMKRGEVVRRINRAKAALGIEAAE